jgi:hypothetical protein
MSARRRYGFDHWDAIALEVGETIQLEPKPQNKCPTAADWNWAASRGA